MKDDKARSWASDKAIEFTQGQFEKPDNCTCSYPQAIVRNMCGHDVSCPVFVEWEQRGGVMPEKTPSLQQGAAQEGVLTHDENVVLNTLVEAWNAFAKIPHSENGWDDRIEFLSAIHAAQNIILSRPTLREMKRRERND